MSRQRKYIHLVEDEWAKVVLSNNNDMFNFLHRFSIALGKLWRDLELRQFDGMLAEDKAALKFAIEQKFASECSRRTNLESILLHYDYMAALGSVEVYKPGYLNPRRTKVPTKPKNGHL